MFLHSYLSFGQWYQPLSTWYQAEAAPAKRTPDVLHFGYGACIDDEVNASLVVPRLETETNKLFKMIFLFPMWDMWSFPGGYQFLKKFQTSNTFPSSNSIGSSLFLVTAGVSEGLCWTDIHWFDAIQLRQPHRSCEQNTGWKCSPARCGRKAQELTDPKDVKTSWNNKKETFTVFLNLFDRYTKKIK